MTPLVAELHNAHKERQRRFAKAAHRAPVVEVQPPIPEPEPEPVLTVDDWVQRQRELHKHHWFSIVSSEQIEERPRRVPLLRDIQRATCAVYGVEFNDLISARRTKDIVRPRMVSMFLIKDMTDLSLPRIGRATGGRDHTTALHAIRKIERLRKIDGELAATIEQIRERLA